MKRQIIFCFLFFILYCQVFSPKRGYFYEKKGSDEYYSQAQVGQVIYSKAKLFWEGQEQKISYLQYVFEGANETHITLTLREYYGRIKDNPDLVKTNNYTYTNGEVLLEDIRLIIGKLSAKEIIYKIEKVSNSKT